MRALVLLLFLFSCTLHDRYCRPDFDATEEWRLQPEATPTCCNDRWWEKFQDPVLDDLIDQALAYNQDLKVAIATVDEFAAQLGISRSQLYPQISATADGGRQKVSLDATPLFPGQPRISDFYDLLFNVSYEIDVWGQIRSANEAALANLISQIDTQKTVVLSLVTSVAATYIQMRQFDQELIIARETFISRQESFKLAKLRFEEGLTSEMPVKQSESEMDFTEAQMKRIELAVAQQENLLCVLIGAPSMDVPRGLTICELCMPLTIPEGLPSDLVNQRPDLLAAEQNLIAANAQIGVARAAFFPQFTLTGQYGYQSIHLKDLLTSPANTWQYGLNILQEIFTGGELTYNLKLTKAQKEAALHQYQSAILTAFQEVNDALIANKISKELVDILQDRVQALAEYYRLAVLRYDNGQVDYLNVLDAERQLFLAELDLVEAQGDSFVSFINLYKSLGGGWVDEANQTAEELNCHEIKEESLCDMLFP